MMDAHTTDEQQIEAIKRWFREYGLVMIIGVIIAVSGSFAWRYWQNSKAEEIAKASSLFDTLQVSQLEKDLPVYHQATDQLMKDYGNTPYAIFAALSLANQAVNEKNFEQAEKQLNLVMTESKDTAIQQIARLRLARVYLQQNKNAEALQLIDKVDNENFKPAILEIKGDILSAAGKNQEATAAYREALAGMEPGSGYRQIAEMKLSEIEGVKK